MPVPCLGGTFGAQPGLERVSQCSPVSAGEWAPTGSSKPLLCPESGFSCPGAAEDKDNTPPGSLPVLLKTGTVAVGTISFDLTLAGVESLNTSQLSKLRVRLRAAYDVPSAARMELRPAAVAGRRRLEASSGPVTVVVSASTCVCASTY